MEGKVNELSILEEERSYYPKIKYVVDTINMMLQMLFEENSLACDHITVKNVYVERINTPFVDSKVTIMMEYEISLERNVSYAQKSERRRTIEKVIGDCYLDTVQDTNYVEFSYSLNPELVPNFRPGNEFDIEGIEEQLQAEDAEGYDRINDRHVFINDVTGPNGSQAVEHEIFRVDLDDYFAQTSKK